MVTRLHRHELSVAARYDRLYGGRSAWSAVARWLGSPLGAFFVNTPLYLLPAQINLQPRHRVLEVGCAHGAGLRFLTARFPFRQPPVGVDASLEALRRGARTWSTARVPLVAATASRLPFAPESFDLVLAGHTVRHLSDEGLLRFLFEAERVLRPGGLLALWEFAPTASPTLNRLNARLLDALGGAGRLRGFGRLAYFASEAGYVVIERPVLRPFLFPPIPRTGLLAKKASPDSKFQVPGSKGDGA
jgi:SAM-dependent methyltransferase